MRKVVILLALVLTGMVGMAQTKVGSYTTFAGTTADTLTASATKTYVLDLLKYQTDQGVNVELFADLVSGTETFYVKCYWSNDGTNIPATAADSLNKSHASDFVYQKNFATAGGKYLVVKAIATSATQKSRLYGYVNCYTK